MKCFRFSYFILLILLCTCIPEELPDYGYPVLSTSVVTINANGVTLSGTIEFAHPEAVLDHGFVWGMDKEKLSLDDSFLASLGAVSGESFLATIGSTLILRKTYYARSYAKTKFKTVYGPMVKFVSLGSEGPKVKSFLPAEGGYGDTLRVSGKNFSFNKETNKVTFEGISATVAEATDTVLKVVVPALTKLNNKIKVSILDNVTEAPGTFRIKSPTIKSISKSPFTVCDTLIIDGENLGAFGDMPFVRFNDNTGNVVSVSPKQIKVKMPRIIENPITVKVSSSLFDVAVPGTVTQIHPEVTSIQPATYSPGDTIRVSFKNWSACETMSATLYTPYQLFPVQVIESTSDVLKFIAPDVCIGSLKLQLFGPTISFSPAVELKREPPTVHSIEPNHGRVNDEVIIKGENFFDKTWLNPTNFVNLTYASSKELRGTVSELLLLESSTIDVYVNGCGGSTLVPDAFTFDAPEIHSITPGLVNGWDEVITIYGKNFSSTQNKIVIGNNTANPIYAAASYEGDRITLVANEFLKSEELSEFISGQIEITTVQGLSVKSAFHLTISYESTWKPELSFPGLARAEAVSMNINGRVFVGLGGAYPAAYTDWWEFDESGGWTHKENFPGSMDNLIVPTGIASGKGYIGYFFTSKKWWQYDPATDHWLSKADFPGASRFAHFILSLNDKIYVGGGRTYTGATTADGLPMKDFWEYDPATDQWTQKANLPESPLMQALAFTHNGKGYTFGKAGNTLTTMSYDPAANQWSSQPVTAPGTPEFYSNWKIMKFDDYAILQTYQSSTPAIYKFDPEANRFEHSLSTFGADRGGPTLFILNNRGYMGLGYRDQFLKDMWSFDPVLLKY